MVRLTTRELRRMLSDSVNRVAYQGERVIVMRHGREVAALIPMVDMQKLDQAKGEGQG